MEMMFNADQVRATVEPINYDPIPPGRYEAVIVEAITEESRTGNGSYLSIVFQVEHNGSQRKIWENYNLWHSNPKAVAVNQARVLELCDAIGKSKGFFSPAELIGGRLSAEVTVETRDDKKSNKIKRAHPSNYAAAPSPVAAPVAQQIVDHAGQAAAQLVQQSNAIAQHVVGHTPQAAVPPVQAFPGAATPPQYQAFPGAPAHQPVQTTDQPLKVTTPDEIPF